LAAEAMGICSVLEEVESLDKDHKVEEEEISGENINQEICLKRCSHIKLAVHDSLKNLQQFQKQEIQLNKYESLP
jgi:predicted transcriptional regulator